MRSLSILVLAAFCVFVTVDSALAECTYPSDIAADGSRCGGRASTVRPGGK